MTPLATLRKEVVKAEKHARSIGDGETSRSIVFYYWKGSTHAYRSVLKLIDALAAGKGTRA